MSLQLYFFDKLFRVILKRHFSKQPDVLGLRQIMEKYASSAPPLPRNIECESMQLGGVPTERLQTSSADSSRALLYIHGGAFVACSPVNHRPITRRLAVALGCPIYVVDYRLAPEHPFPAGLEDVVAAYRALLAKGISPKHIAVGGDSAGGNLTLGLSLTLKTLGLAQPAALFCLSAPTDFTAPLPSRTENTKSDAMFDPKMFPSVIEHYCPKADLTDPLLSPLRGDHAGMPATLLMCAQRELLRDDSIELAAKMKATGVEVRLEVWPHVFHAWPVIADHLPEAKAAIAIIAEFVRARL